MEEFIWKVIGIVFNVGVVVLFIGFVVWLLCKIFLPPALYNYFFHNDCYTPEERQKVEEILRKALGKKKDADE